MVENIFQNFESKIFIEQFNSIQKEYIFRIDKGVKEYLKLLDELKAKEVELNIKEKKMFCIEQNYKNELNRIDKESLVLQENQKTYKLEKLNIEKRLKELFENEQKINSDKIKLEVNMQKYSESRRDFDTYKDATSKDIECRLKDVKNKEQTVNAEKELLEIKINDLKVEKESFELIKISIKEELENLKNENV